MPVWRVFSPSSPPRPLKPAPSVPHRPQKGLAQSFPSQEKTGYPTQKPLALLDRIISASSNPGDMVLDPFCGCATALVAAETLGRRWAGIDLSPLAVRLVGQRLRDQHGVFGQITARDDVPKRTDLGEHGRKEYATGAWCSSHSAISRWITSSRSLGAGAITRTIYSYSAGPVTLRRASERWKR